MHSRAGKDASAPVEADTHAAQQAPSKTAEKREVEDYETPVRSGVCAAPACLPGTFVADLKDDGFDLDKLHLGRNILHMCWGMGFIQLRHHKGVRLHDELVGLLLSFVVFVEMMRLNYPWFNRLCATLFGDIMRRSELHRFTSVMYYLGGVLAVSRITQGNFLVYDASVCCLAFGDPMASLGGFLSGSKWALANGKCIMGFLFGWFFNFTALIWVYSHEKQARREMAFLGMHSHTARITMALFAGMIGAAAELAVPSPPPKLEASAKFPLGLDDNFVVPLVTCILVQHYLDWASSDQHFGHMY